MKQPSSKNGRVLVAEDDEVVRRVMRRTLERAGYEVLVAADGEEALRTLTSMACDVLVSDVVMPRRDGMNLLRELRSLDLAVPVVLVSGHSPETEAIVEALDRGVAAYLPKPFLSADLAGAVAKAVARARTNELVQENDAFDRVLATLFMHRQPIARWSEQRVYGWECLLRANEPALPHPGAVLGAAERLGRLDEIGRAIRARCAAAVPRDARLFVNLHPADLGDAQLYDPDSPLGAVAGSVVLEITERAHLAAVPSAAGAVARLREMGYAIAIDDIGAGFASLSSIEALAPDMVKLDMSLVRDVHRSKTKQRLIDTLARACRDLGIEVVAEGVETPDELAALLDLGCDFFQGYLLARPGVEFPQPRWDVLQSRVS